MMNTIPWLVLAVILVGVWLILKGAAVAVGSTVTLIFGILVVVFAFLSVVAPRTWRRP